MEFQKMNFREELAKVSPKIRKGAEIYIWGTGNGWKQIRQRYKTIHNIKLEDFIYAFIDNDPLKQHTGFYGKRIIAPAEIDKENAVVMISLNDYPDRSVLRQLLRMGFQWRSDCFDNAYLEWMLWRYNRLQFSRFKGKHDGERCFIIGNGPSLRTHDLDRLKNEITFAVNHIFNVFDKTSWRPTYYVIEDTLFEIDSKTICENINGIKFIYAPAALMFEGFEVENAYYYNSDTRIAHQQYPYTAEFSTEPGTVFWATTIVYTCLQLAALMGFKEIYLIGVDHNFPVRRKANGEVIYSEAKAHFYKEQANVSFSYDTGTNIDLLNSGYEAAREYADNNGFKIYNATRGGKLEAFERVDFNNIVL